MNSTEVVSTLLETAVASSAAMLAVLLLRGPVRQWLGASAGYLLWLAVPVALGAVLLPGARIEAVPMVASSAAVQIGAILTATAAPVLRWPALLIAIWLCGAVLMVGRLLHQQRSFVRQLGVLALREDGCWQAQGVAGLPAAIGLWRPKIVLPAGFEARYTAQKRQLVLLHERVHLRRGDIAVNAALALLHCLYWFNPLLPLALRRCRQDQELSCDERVIAHSAGARRSYGNAMLKTGLALSPLPVGCHWQNHHPLKERIAMLKRPVPGKKQWAAMLLVSLAVSSALGYTAWAAQPAKPSEVKAGVLHAVVLQVDADGERQQFEIREQAGTPFSFALQSAKGVLWSGEFTLQPSDEQRLRLSGELRAEGAVVSRPNLLVAADMPAGVKAVTADGRSVLDVVLQVAPHGATGAPASAAQGRIAVEPEPMPASVPSFAQMAPPRYPPSMNTGEVVLKIDVAASGAVTAVQVERSSGHADLDEAATQTAHGWKLNPGYKDGKPVAGQVRVPVRFEADETLSETREVTS